MFDVHAHLHDEAFVGDRDATVDRARAVGLEGIVTIGTDLEENRRAVACAQAYSDVWVSVGLHPHFFNEAEENTNSSTQIPNKTQSRDQKFQKEIQELRAIAESSNRVVAIGECGLDYYRRQSADSNQQETITEEQKVLQREGFLAQIAIAEDLDLPLIIHTRPSLGSMDAYEDIFEILKERQGKLTAILHCYMGDLSVTEKFLSLPGVSFSFTGNITYKGKEGSDRDETLRMIPIDRMLSETDCPYLAPVPYRGQRNEPAYVAEVVRCIALIRQMTYTETEERIGINVRRAFPRMFEII